MSKIPCFLIVPTNRTERRLRRFVLSSDVALKCPGKMGYHDATAAFPEGHCTFDKGEQVYRWNDEFEIPSHEDPRWPTKCEGCDYVFAADDEWQLFHEVIHARQDNPNITMTLGSCPPGAMWDAFWYPEKGPDGRSLCVALPPNGGHDYWHIDGPSKDGGKWTRTGDPLHVTARPSILTPRYHGWLTDGFLVSC